jgi:DNA-binding transcriptional ArsR family regulator
MNVGMNLATVNHAENQAELFAVFANATRIRILLAMAQGERSVGWIARKVDISIQNSSHHLRYMKDKGILKSRRVGQRIRYRIARPDLVNELLATAAKESLS